MATPEEIALRKKIDELNEQIIQLFKVVEIMAQKMIYIEQETQQLHRDIIEELKEFKEEIDIDKR
jgi:archaellum component FlaC